MSESHPSQYRQLLPRPMRGGPSGPPPPRTAVPKRSIVKVACDACRQHKAKCDGRRPNCSTCIAAGRDCRYAAHPLELQLAAIKRKHDELQERMVDHENLYETLRVRPPEEAEEVLRRIRAGGDIKSMTEDIEGGNLLLELISPPAFTPPQLPAQSVPFHEAAPPGPFASDPQAQLPVREGRLSFDRTMFEEDLKSLNPLSPSSSPPDMLLFCSPFLVNALLAVSCLFTKNQATFYVPSDPNSRGQAFAIEAARLLALEDTSPSLPVAQGLALMCVYEGALGSGEAASSYHSRMQARYLTLRLDEIPRSADAAIAGARQRREARALSWIAWGFYVWDWKPMHGLCRRLVIRKPKRQKTWRDEALTPLSNKDNPGYWWFPYPVSVVPQNGLKREIFGAECDLAEITEQVLDFLIPLEEGWPPRRNAHRALELYTELTRWKFSLPERLRAEDTVLPSAILLHLSVELIIISLLRPFDGLSKEEFGPFNPVTMSYAHASNAMWTVWHFRALYTLRNEYWMIQAASICAFRVLFDIDASPIQLETFAKACRALVELGESFPVATEVIRSIDSVVKKQRLTLPSYANEHLSSHGGGSSDDLRVVKVRDHSVIVQRADSQCHLDHLTLTGLLSVMPREAGPD
ncbi:hypothetical protein B0J13DRAFT_590204 [Dactylonectria estremocensis]|uniref:Zn(2)-C6 fungal-type domain-containing protein n=1 Tax=Dactylonectria estremocensis TaxID=1079267 RepID=A0A9P9IFT4_9HYPO|nr:hypothetical protein B0J13DRAFT_590204 [Dactylonectria estremocensis]